MTTRLREWVRDGAIGEYDAAFARLVEDIDRRAGSAPQACVAIAAALASLRTREGDVCFVPADIAATVWPEGEAALPPAGEWLAALRRSAAVTTDGASPAPLVLDAAGRLYLHRYWAYEQSLASRITEMASSSIVLDTSELRKAIERWFGPAPAEYDGQRVAAAVCAMRRLSVISGGPGTGKTTTVARVLGVLRDLHGPEHRVLLAAPTGKAAARLQWSIGNAGQRLGLDVPLAGEVQTIHRMLGAVPGSIRFRHDEDHPLPADCVVVDEASMVDLALAAKLLRAIPSHARLILLGDPGQLASVEAGAVLASVCAGARGFSSAMADRLHGVTGCVPRVDRDASPLSDCVTVLERSHRFDAAGAIAALAAAIRAGDVEAVESALRGAGGAVQHVGEAPQAVLDAMRAGFDRFVALVRAGAAADVLLEAADAFRVLAATRGGPLGSVQLNAAFEHRLKRDSGAPDRADWYSGRLVMITANDYALRLFNGDVGVALAGADGQLRVHFAPARAGEPPRAFAASRVPRCESAFALTVHKSQGSEFGEVLIAMPTADSPMATRELLYTAVTRASAKVSLAGPRDAVAAATRRTQARRSGLADALWSDGAGRG